MKSYAVFRITLAAPTVLVAAMLLSLPVSASAQDWAQGLFSEQSHNFGTVATGAECWHRLKLTNNLTVPVVIGGVRTSCSCAMVREPGQNVLQPGQSTEIEIGMDTHRFMRDRNSNLIVTFTSPEYREVRIPVSVYIRTDVVLTPGEVNFGPVAKGQGAERKIEVAYAGNPNWQILKVDTNNNPNINAKVVQTARGGDGNVKYDLFVSLAPGAPAGFIRQQIALITSDANNPRVPVQVQGRVETEFTVTPANQVLGTLHPGDEKTVNFVVRGRKPFAIAKIEVESNRQNCKMVMPKDTKPVHVLPITIAAPKEPGEFTEEFTLTIEGRDEPITFTARGTTVATAAKIEGE